MNHFVDDETKELFAERWIEARVVRESAESGYLHRLAVRVSGRETDSSFVLTHTFGNFEPLRQHVYDGRVDVVDAVSAFS